MYERVRAARVSLFFTLLSQRGSKLTPARIIARRAGAVGWWRRYRNGMADHDCVLSHPHFMNEQTHDAFTSCRGEGNCPCPQSPKKLRRRFDQGHLGAAIKFRGLQGLRFGLDGTPSGLERGLSFNSSRVMTSSWQASSRRRILVVMRANSPCSESVRCRTSVVSLAASILRLISPWMNSGFSSRASTSWCPRPGPGF